MLIEHLWLSFQRCYLFREVMQVISSNEIISIFVQKVLNVCWYKTLFVAFLGVAGGGGCFLNSMKSSTMNKKNPHSSDKHYVVLRLRAIARTKVCSSGSRKRFQP